MLLAVELYEKQQWKDYLVWMFTTIFQPCRDYVTLIILVFCPLQDYEDFFESKENNTVFAFLGLSSQTSLKVRDINT